ncbi:MAG: MFS transporter [Clostridia bacterium]|nr:MFS transporter [Clostridia bacterium]
MVTLLLIIIYASFISLGLPDSLFGVSWPVIHTALGADMGFASLLTILIGLCTAGMSLFAGRFIRRFGTGPVTAVSVLLTALGLFGVSLCPTVCWMIPCMICIGLGAGAVDVGLNDYVATHFKARHMNWLHCFWGLGVTLSPLIMAHFLKSASWREGYRSVALIQCGFALLLLCALPLWKAVAARRAAGPSETPESLPEPDIRPIRIPGVPLAMLMLALYCGFEYILGTWTASYLIYTRHMAAADAAGRASLYYGGIMLGRFLCGFAAMRVGDRALIRAGLGVMLLGAALLALPFGQDCALAGLLLIGLGCGPVFPCTLHATGERFGRRYSADIVGYQMGGAYCGTLVIQPLFGLVASRTGFHIMPWALIGLALLQCLLLWRLEARLQNARLAKEAAHV